MVILWLTWSSTTGCIHYLLWSLRWLWLLDWRVIQTVSAVTQELVIGNFTKIFKERDLIFKPTMTVVHSIKWLSAWSSRPALATAARNGSTLKRSKDWEGLKAWQDNIVSKERSCVNLICTKFKVLHRFSQTGWIIRPHMLVALILRYKLRQTDDELDLLQ